MLNMLCYFKTLQTLLLEMFSVFFINALYWLEYDDKENQFQF